MKRYLLDTKRVGTSKETRVNDDENLSFFLWLIIYSRENSSWTVLGNFYGCKVARLKLIGCIV
jgi:hypothetical protein